MPDRAPKDIRDKIGEALAKSRKMHGNRQRLSSGEQSAVILCEKTDETAEAAIAEFNEKTKNKYRLERYSDLAEFATSVAKYKNNIKAVFYHEDDQLKAPREYLLEDLKELKDKIFSYTSSDPVEIANIMAETLKKLEERTILVVTNNEATSHLYEAVFDAGFRNSGIHLNFLNDFKDIKKYKDKKPDLLIIDDRIFGEENDPSEIRKIIKEKFKNDPKVLFGTNDYILGDGEYVRGNEAQNEPVLPLNKTAAFDRELSHSEQVIQSRANLEVKDGLLGR